MLVSDIPKTIYRLDSYCMCPPVLRFDFIMAVAAIQQGNRVVYFNERARSINCGD